MKRSQAIKKIEDLLNNVDGDKVRISNKLLANLILGTVEEMGMLPPEIQTTDYFKPKNKWEKE